MTKQQLVDVLHRPTIDEALLFNSANFLISCGVFVCFGRGAVGLARIVWEDTFLPSFGQPLLLQMDLQWLALSFGFTLAGGCGALFWGRWFFRRCRPAAARAEAAPDAWPPPPITPAGPPAA